MHTEEEAKTKWCPYRNARPEWPFPSISGSDFENLTIAQSPFNCIASQCMAWRWGLGYTGHTEEFTGNNKDLPERGEGFQWLRFGENLDEEGNGTFRLYRRRGFCGLAGK